MSSFARYGLGAGTVPTYANFASLPALASDGALAVTLDNDTLYVFNLGTLTWLSVGGSSVPLNVGNLDAQAANSKGATITLNQLFMQSASSTNPGLVNNTTQSFSGNKTFSGSTTAMSSGSSVIPFIIQAAPLTPTNVTWTQTNGSETVVGNTLTRTAAGTGFNVTGGNSTQQIVTGKSGYVIFTAADTTNLLIVGLSAKTNASYAATATDFGFYLSGGGVLQIIDGGSFFSAGTYNTGDSFRVQETSNVVTFIQNNVVIRTSSNAPSFPLFAQANLASQGATVTATIVTDSAAAQTVDIFEVNDSNNFSLAKVDKSGNISAQNLSGTNSGDVTIGAFGSTPNANGLSLSGQVLNLQPADSTHSGGLKSADWNTFNNKQSALTLGNLTDAGTDGITVTGGTGAVVGSGTSLSQQVADTTHNGYLSSTNWNTFNSKQVGPLTGDVTTTGAAATLATVNSNTGSFGSSTAIPSFTVNGKGLITAASTNVVIAPAGTLTGTTLASNVVTSSLTSVGTIATGVWNGTTIAIANGGTGQTSASASFNALSPMTTGGDIIYGGASGAGTRLANGSSGQILTSNGGTSAPSWQANAAAVTNNFYSGFMPNGSSWSTSSATLVDPTNSGGNTLTQRQGNGITVTAAASNKPGITFTPAASTSIYMISASFAVNNSSTANASMSLTDGTTTITTESALFGIGVNANYPVNLSGIYAPGTGSAVTVKIQLATSAATVSMGPSGTIAASIEWSVIQIS